MKKLFTLLIAFMLALSFNANAAAPNDGWNTYNSINPAIGEIYGFNTSISIDFDFDVYSAGGNKEPQNIVFKLPSGQEIKCYTFTNGNTATITLGEKESTNVYTQSGKYILTIPANCMADTPFTGKKYNAQMSFEWTVVPAPLQMGTVTPTPNTTVQDLSTITISFDVPVERYGPKSGVTLGGKPIKDIQISTDGDISIATITSEETFDTEEVVLSIPENLFQKIGTSSRNKAVQYTWNLVKASLGITAPEFIFKGDVANVTLDLTNGIPFAGFQLDMVLPEGLTVEPPAGAASKFVLSRADGHKIMDGTVRNTPGAIRLLSYADNGKVYKDNAGTLVTFAVRATEKFEGGNIAISNIKFADPEGNKYELLNVAAAIESRTYVSSITIAPTALNLETNETATVEATVLPDAAFDKTYVWSSSNPNIVTVDAAGNVTAGGVGEAYIIATAQDGSGKTAQIPVTVVYTHATALTITPATVLFEVGNRQTLTATFDKETNKKADIVWTSNKTEVAEIVITEGVVEVVGKAIGETTVIAQLKNGNEVVLEKTIPVKVDATMATTLAVNPAQVMLETGGKTTLVAVVDDKASNPKIRWYVEEGGEQYVSVDENGVVTALAVTPAAVKVYAATGDGSNLTAYSEVTVVATLVENVTIALVDPNDDNQLMNKETVRLVANLTGTTNKNILWTSSDEAMATVEVVEGVAVVTAGSKTGEVTIFATIEGTNIRGEYKLTIIPTPATEIAINYEGETKFETGAGQVTLTATVGTELATDKTYAWTSSDEEIATVNENGVVTFGEKPGVVNITAKANGAAEGKTVEATINFEVVYTFAETITISKVNEADDFVLKAGESLTLKATTDAATNKKIRWSSDNEAVTVEDGVVTALKYVAGDVTIKAQIFNGETAVVTAQQVITLATTPGDVDNDAIIDVADITATAGYILGDRDPEFIFDAADINNSGTINVTDITLMVNIILSQEDEPEQQAAISRARQYADSSNSLFIDNFSIAEGETRQIAVMLDNSVAFTAFQADIYLPEGLEIVEAALSDRKVDHSLAFAVRNNGSVRLLSYSLGLNEYAESNGEFVYLTVKAADNFVGDFQIEIDNVTFVMANHTKYYLEPTVADVTGYTGVEGVEGDEIVVKVVGNSIVAPEGAEVYDLNGLRVNAENLAKGIYIVKVGDQVVKVII